MLLTPVRAGALERGLQRGVRVMGHRGPGSRQGRNTRASLPLSGLLQGPPVGNSRWPAADTGSVPRRGQPPRAQSRMGSVTGM